MIITGIPFDEKLNIGVLSKVFERKRISNCYKYFWFQAILENIVEDKVVFTYSGDGDFASIGIAESLHTALRGEKITSLCINNTTYGMTGGQLGPTTLMGQVTTTSPTGRNKDYFGYPIKIAEHIALCDGTAFSARVAVDTVPHINDAKRAIKKAFQVQLDGLGFGFVEVLSSCTTNWHLSPEDAHKRIREEMMPVFPLGIFKDTSEESK
mgnify:CR=1 FL=1